MIEINKKHLCENCFEQTDAEVCPFCGYAPGKAASDPALLAPGSILLGKYVVGRIIGKGGFGSTYLAYDVTADKTVAVKEYFPYSIAVRTAGSLSVTVSNDEDVQAFKIGAEKFYDEAKLISQFNGSPNIVSVYELFYENNTVYFAMEYIRGCTLKEYIRDHGMLSASQAMYVALGVSNALAEAHKANVLHRDISPDNIIICRDGNVKLIDFGAARQMASEQSQSFSVILKPGFAPIEQYRRKGNQGPWTDIYSLGATIYFAITGDIPEDPMARFDNDDTFNENLFNIDPELWQIIKKATNIKSEDRYADIDEMKRDLESIPIGPEPITLPEDSGEENMSIRASVPVVTVSPNEKQRISFDTAGDSAKKEASKKRVRSAVISACGIAAAASVILIAVMLKKPGHIADNESRESNLSSNISNTSNISDTVSDSVISDTASNTESGDPGIKRVYDPLGDYKSKTFYVTLEDEYKPLYENIYECMANSEDKIKFNYGEWQFGLVNVTYYKVLYDNPQYCHIQQFYYNYWEENNNGEIDDDEYIKEIDPFYITEYSQIPWERVSKVLSECDPNDSVIDKLAYVHDYLVKNTDTIERYMNASCTSAWGAVVDYIADDVGFAKGFCYYAQGLGVPCYVVDGQLNGEPRSWCRLKLGDTWYNVDPYGDKLASSSGSDECCKTYFLTNDDFIKRCGYVQNPEYDMLWEGEYAANSPDENHYLAQHG